MNRRAFFATATGAAICAPFIATEARAAYEQVRLRELYNTDMSFTDYALEKEGQRVSIVGYMAPPLKAESTFYVLTNRPMAVCPFCESEAEWPDDILAVYARRVIDVVPFNVMIATTGTLELGTYKDPELGFVSRVRLTDAFQERV
ncbi:hypothetical protein [Pelagibacterium halotolerans]|uniref:hypothetical protein n=1 Tax=Pelagibacterium halotolerans TaxID=531813 RepID=UPI00384F1637